jgi:hypothetical protein
MGTLPLMVILATLSAGVPAAAACGVLHFHRAHFADDPLGVALDQFRPQLVQVFGQSGPRIGQGYTDDRLPLGTRDASESTANRFQPNCSQNRTAPERPSLTPAKMVFNQTHEIFGRDCLAKSKLHSERHNAQTLAAAQQSRLG